MRETLALASAQLVHRGPDDCGVWTDAAAGVGLAHRRLAILDLSPAGSQPMRSASGRYVLVLNGEIYNHLQLRQDVEARGKAGGWRGHSDTESLLAAFDAWGVEDALKRAEGMFAIAVWDAAERSLHLARDRMGEKPLYYGWLGNVLAFGSELKALRAIPGFAGDVDRDALALLFRHSYIPAPRTIYRGIRKLPPGTSARIKYGKSAQNRAVQVRPYWSLREIAERASLRQFPGSEAEAAGALEDHLRRAVQQQMVADVPLGALLSGGVDSSTVVALMQSLSRRPVRTFSIGFVEADYNEAHHARAVARHLGTEHTELYVTAREAMDVIPRLPDVYDEPFADSSQVPSVLVAELARRHVTVALSGDGGDELFGGYARYLRASAMFRLVRRLPRPARRWVARSIRAVPAAGWDRAVSIATAVLPRRLRPARAGERAHKAAALISHTTPETLYHGLVSHWTEPTEIVLGAQEPLTALTDPSAWPEVAEFIHRLMYLDSVSYLPDDILVKVDRAAMSTSLETRIPLLDHRLVEFAWTLPLAMKVRDGEGKRILKRVLRRYVPDALTARPKMGFGIPIGDWLRDPLRPWAEELLSEMRLRREGYLDPAPILRKWNEHLSGQRNWQYHLWDVLMFQAWLGRQKP